MDKAPERPVTQPTATPESVVEFEPERPETGTLKKVKKVKKPKGGGQEAAE